jgi:hypothetical protein
MRSACAQISIYVQRVVWSQEMSPFTTVRLALLGLISLGVGAICLKAYLSGDGWVHVIFPRGDIGKLLVDGHEVKPNAKESRAYTYTIPQGSHRVSIELAHHPSKTYQLKIANGFAFMLLPAVDEQCFVLIDATESHYGGKKRSTVLKRFDAHRALDVEDCPYFGFEALPSRKKSSASAHVVADIPCAQLADSDESILTALGE